MDEERWYKGTECLKGNPSEPQKGAKIRALLVVLLKRNMPGLVDDGTTFVGQYPNGLIYVHGLTAWRSSSDSVSLLCLLKSTLPHWSLALFGPARVNSMICRALKWSLKYQVREPQLHVAKWPSLERSGNVSFLLVWESELDLCVCFVCPCMFVCLTKVSTSRQLTEQVDSCSNCLTRGNTDGQAHGIMLWRLFCM